MKMVWCLGWQPVKLDWSMERSLRSSKLSNRLVRCGAPLKLIDPRQRSPTMTIKWLVRIWGLWKRLHKLTKLVSNKSPTFLQRSHKWVREVWPAAAVELLTFPQKRSSRTIRIKIAVLSDHRWDNHSTAASFSLIKRSGPLDIKFLHSTHNRKWLKRTLDLAFSHNNSWQRSEQLKNSTRSVTGQSWFPAISTT